MYDDTQPKCMSGCFVRLIFYVPDFNGSLIYGTRSKFFLMKMVFCYRESRFMMRNHKYHFKTTVGEQM